MSETISLRRSGTAIHQFGPKQLFLSPLSPFAFLYEVQATFPQLPLRTIKRRRGREKKAKLYSNLPLKSRLNLWPASGRLKITISHSNKRTTGPPCGNGRGLGFVL